MTDEADKAKARGLACVALAPPNDSSEEQAFDWAVIVIANAIAAARREGERGWTRCSERMPEGEPRYVFAWCPEEHARSVWFIPRVEVHIRIGPANTPATHWQEMPEPPALPGAADGC